MEKRKIKYFIGKMENSEKSSRRKNFKSKYFFALKHEKLFDFFLFDLSKAVVLPRQAIKEH